MKPRYYAVTAALSLLHLALSEVHEHHRHNHDKRGDVIVTGTTTQMVTQEVSVSYEQVNKVVYIDENDKPTSTSTIFQNKIGSPETVKQRETLAAAKDQTKPKNKGKGQDHGKQKVQAQGKGQGKGEDHGRGNNHAQGQNQGQAQDQPPAASSIFSEPFLAHPSQSAGSGDAGGNTGGSGIGFTSGVTYSPYSADHSCKSEGQVASDLADLSGFDVVRLYGTDCNQVAHVLKAVNGKASIFAGIYKIGDVDAEVKTMAAAVGANWGSISAVSVGNELVNSGQASVGQVTAAVAKARSALKAAGYTGPVTTVDTMMAMQDNPGLCQASDFCAINCHAFFDGNVLPNDAGKFVSDWVRQISKAAGGKRVVVTESGWPTRGNKNNKAIPGKAQHDQAMQSLKSSFSKDLILYTLYNDMWKSDSGATHGAEKYWGMRGPA